MKWIAALGLALSMATPAHCAEDFLGTVVEVQDGDTFDVKTDTRTVRIRLCGVDSPEHGQPGFGPATAAMVNMVHGKQVHCLQVGMGTPCDGRSKPTNRNRVVAQCFIGDKDVAMEMVRMKQACYWPKFSADHYRVDSSSCAKR